MFFQKRPDVFPKTSRCFSENVPMFFQKRPDVLCQSYIMNDKFTTNPAQNAKFQEIKAMFLRSYR